MKTCRETGRAGKGTDTGTGKVIGASGMKSEENMVIAEIEEKGMVKETGIKKTNNA
jgi:hypothetical protein